MVIITCLISMEKTGSIPVCRTKKQKVSRNMGKFPRQDAVMPVDVLEAKIREIFSRPEMFCHDKLALEEVVYTLFEYIAQYKLGIQDLNIRYSSVVRKYSNGPLRFSKINSFQEMKLVLETFIREQYQSCGETWYSQ